MSLEPITVKAPGSMMIMGEHAVLHQHPALVASINRWITVTLSSRNDEQLLIQSVYGEIEQPMHVKPTETWAQWICFVIRSFFDDLPELKYGLNIHIESTFEGAVGLSSSTALTVSILFALAHWIAAESSEDKKKQWVFEEAMCLLEQYHKVASGAALQAVIFGGLRLYTAASKQSRCIEKAVRCYLVYCGYKTPTEEVVKVITEKFKDNPQQLKSIYHDMGECVAQGVDALSHDHAEKFYASVDRYYLLQKQLGTSDDLIDQMIDLSRQSQTALAAKISGAGLGDCILVIGEMDKNLWRPMKDIQVIEVEIVSEGVHLC
jgi:mevalonate kinase